MRGARFEARAGLVRHAHHVVESREADVLVEGVGGERGVVHAPRGAVCVEMPAEERLREALGELRVVRKLEANEGHLTSGLVQGTVAGRASLLQGRSAPTGDPLERHVVRARSLQSGNRRGCCVPIWSHGDASRARDGGRGGRANPRGKNRTRAPSARSLDGEERVRLCNARGCGRGPGAHLPNKVPAKVRLHI